MSKCPRGRRWWPWHRWRFWGPVEDAKKPLAGAYTVRCKRCGSKRVVTDW